MIDRARRSLARWCHALDARPWLLTAMNIIAALLFVIGCLLFYSPSAQSAGITFFLVGSALFLASALGDALLRFGPTEQ